VDLTKIALLQVDSSTAIPIQTRIDQTLHNLETTLKEKPKLVMLPELWATGAFMVEQTKAQAKEFLEPTLEKLKQLAKKYETWIHAGSFLEEPQSRT